MSQQIKSDYNGMVLAKPAHLSDKEWADTTHSLKQSQGGRLFSNHEHREPSKGAMAVPSNEHMDFEVDRIKREKAEAKAAKAGKTAAPADAGSLVE